MEDKRENIQATDALQEAKVLFCIGLALIFFGFVFLGGFAFADGNAGASTLKDFALSSILDYIHKLVTFVFLPIGIVVCAAKMIYVGVAGYIMHDDILNSKEKNWYGGASVEDDPGTCFKRSVKGFAYGFAWIAGVWVLFTIVLQITSMLVGTLASSGMF